MVKHKLNKHKIKKAWSFRKIVVAAVVLAALVGIGWLVYQRSQVKEPSIKEVTKVVKQLESYPPAYKQAGLPKYPGGEVTNFSDQDDTAAQVISLIVTTRDSVSKAVAYFDKKLTADGWKADEASTKLTTKSLYYQSYHKSNQQFDIIAQYSKENQETTVTIDWHLEK